jgi:imidazolonepropionase
MQTLIVNIKELLQVRENPIEKVSGKEMGLLPSLKNAFLLIEHDLIIDFGLMENCPKINPNTIIDANGKIVLPTWCDSHTHIVYAGNREQEFVDRINGLSYEEIANRGGGILNSAKKLQETSEEELYNQSRVRLEEIIRLGTGAVEIKSGYGLTVEDELKMLRVIKRLKQNYSITIKATFLGAHAYPSEYAENHKGYIDLILGQMIPTIAHEKLADFIDVFCEKGYFSIEETEAILKCGLKYGLLPKIHVNQFHSIGGVKLGVTNGALSVDHLEIMSLLRILKSLKNSETMPVALPSCSYFLGIPYTPARKMIDTGLPIASSNRFQSRLKLHLGNMNFVVSYSLYQNENDARRSH